MYHPHLKFYYLHVAGSSRDANVPKNVGHCNELLSEGATLLF